ncbi:AAA family ATPase [Microlunatus soli]|uniref:Predicted kinase n=1 Tax=Microlunatus soli TaxID=630515 RepID=A0A1H1Q271_9ACTN|nr:ATP-binding protein [Microlunatus soli]SDS17347.1 Predicted kinase [Microlunatus soli]
MNRRLIVLCGRSFSGKSRTAAWLADALPGVVVSLDEINAERGLWGGDGIPLEEWAHTNEIARHRVGDALDSGHTVIVDDTSSPRFLRDGWRELATSSRSSLALVYVDTPIPVIMERLAANRATPTRGDLTDEVLADHLGSFEPPAADEDAIRVQPNTPRATVLEKINRRLVRDIGPDD